MTQKEQKEVLEGLSLSEKRISPKFFYDDLGSRIFQKIMKMPEYYLTNCENEIFVNHSKKITEALGFKEEFYVVEFGAGDGSKTVHLLKTIMAQGYRINYAPIDISQEAIHHLEQRLKKQLPTLQMAPLVGDYFTILQNDLKAIKAHKLYLFLGSNIGNYGVDSVENLIELFSQSMQVGDAFLLGVDLQKDPEVIRQAYDDPQGITKRFNLNLLTRLNREMKANFKLANFDFFCDYNPGSGALKSYLVSLEDQEVTIAGKKIAFTKDEHIWTELSKKYTLKEIEGLAKRHGFTVKKHFLDAQGYFVNSLWIRS